MCQGLLPSIHPETELCQAARRYTRDRTSALDTAQDTDTQVERLGNRSSCEGLRQD
jgi:hypothetical protein